MFNFNIISKIKYAYIFSGLLTLLSLVSFLVWGLKYSIDFTGGTRMDVRFENSVPANAELEEALKDIELKSLTFQPSENNVVLIRYASEEDQVNQEVLSRLKEKYPGTQELQVDYINASVSKELKSKSIWAILWAVVGIMSYIAWAFRKVSRPVESWKYGAGAVIALIHDVLITVGAFSVLGHYFGIEVGIPFVAALLTILGFSVHDTIVVYDRTRENLLKSSSKEKFPDVVNRSLNETLIRSINTSLTVIITLLAIYLFGFMTSAIIFCLSCGLILATFRIAMLAIMFMLAFFALSLRLVFVPLSLSFLGLTADRYDLSLEAGLDFLKGFHIGLFFS